MIHALLILLIVYLGLCYLAAAYLAVRLVVGRRLRRVIAQWWTRHVPDAAPVPPHPHPQPRLQSKAA